MASGLTCPRLIQFSLSLGRPRTLLQPSLSVLKPTTTMSNHRASLLTGLRTGGPRSVSNGGAYNVPQTAAIGSQFPRQASSQFANYNSYDASGFATADYQSVPMSAPAHEAVFSPFPGQPQNNLVLLQAQAQAQALQNAVFAGQANNRFPNAEQQTLQLQFELYKMQVCNFDLKSYWSARSNVTVIIACQSFVAGYSAAANAGPPYRPGPAAAASTAATRPSSH